MDVFLLCLIVAAWVQHAASDVAYAVRGKTPPRIELKMQRAKARTASPLPGSPAHRVGRAVGEYLGDLGRDAVTTAHQRHRRVYERRQTRRAQKWQAKTPKRPTIGEETTVDTKPLTCPECGEPAQRRPPTSWTPAWGEPPPYSHLDGEPLCPVVGDDGYQPAAPEPRGHNPATVTPIDQQEGSTEAMPTPNANPNAETVSLAQALTYTKGMAESAQQGAASAEQSAAHLQAGEVSGPALADLATAQEHLTQAAAAFTSAHQELSKQTAVRDAYASVGNDAGSKQFITTE